MKRKEVIVISATIANEHIYMIRLSQRLKAFRNMMRRARRKIINRSVSVIQDACGDYYYAKRKIHDIEEALKGKYNIIVVTPQAVNMLKKEGAKCGKKP